MLLQVLHLMIAIIQPSLWQVSLASGKSSLASGGPASLPSIEVGSVMAVKIGYVAEGPGYISVDQEVVGAQKKLWEAFSSLKAKKLWEPILRRYRFLRPFLKTAEENYIDLALFHNF